jgi:hypothetical protein
MNNMPVSGCSSEKKFDPINRKTVCTCTRARNGNLEVPLYLLKAKQGYTVRKRMEKVKCIQYILITVGMKFRN